MDRLPSWLLALKEILSGSKIAHNLAIGEIGNGNSSAEIDTGNAIYFDEIGDECLNEFEDGLDG